MPRRSNRRPDGAQPCKQHSDRALSLMLLGDFETAFWARSAVTAFQPQLAGDCGVWHGKKFEPSTFPRSFGIKQIISLRRGLWFLLLVQR
ncbi:hypothetical protein Lpp227_04541 [Lacticaseibacillus paracasei subsp. paracasei Lpp227]|nr:hypothetical protein Lpp227_04541 [Lacticaseibacillus paracasei subsp. paracasei Lpp227]